MFLLDKRASGILMHISSLPGKTGIGTMGKNAYAFVDFLKDACQTYWQILPIGPTSYGDSPYQSFSTFAGNPYFIDLELLEKDNLIKPSDYQNIKWSDLDTEVDYGCIYIERQKVFQIVYSNFIKKLPEDFAVFCQENSFWLEDYSLFMALKDSHNGVSFDQWEEDLIKRNPQTLKICYSKYNDKVTYYKMLQYLFYKQYKALKTYANEKGIKIIGDIPIYVAVDSADVWSNPQLFQLDENLRPVEVAGCPPDAFSADGQLWGNPVYNWDNMKKDNYSWWKKRLEMSLKNYDVLRIDHFRGFESFYCIPFGSQTAKKGEWKKGPGAALFEEIKKSYGDLPIIAEDLGFLTDSVKKMLADVGFPGMKILQFAFDSREETGYLPESYPKNSVVYTGTHDNSTIKGWMETCRPDDLNFAKNYLNADNNSLPEKMMRAAMQSISNTCILTMQDLLGLDGKARMNEPSTVGKNWKWRAEENYISPKVTSFLKEMTQTSKRAD